MADDANKAFSFGKTPLRALKTFGVAGVLGDKSEVFYGSIFTTQHIGRVTDLIAAKLHDEGLDELRLRALLLFSAFEVFRSQGDSKRRLTEPLVIECGLDEDRVAVGVSFTADEEHFPRLQGLAERIASNQAESEFERLLAEIHSHSDCTIVRAQGSVRRVEIVALLGIPDKIGSEALASKIPLQVVEIGANQKVDPPKVKAYVELGDLDYPQLLEESLAKRDEPPPATGEVLMHGCKELDDAVKIRATNLLEALAGQKTVGGKRGLGAEGEVFRVKGSQSGEEEGSIFKVTSGGAIQLSEGAVLVKGTPAASEQEGGSYQVKGLEKQDDHEEEEGEEEEEESNNRLQDVIDKVKSAWPFRFGRGKKAAEEEQGEDDADEAEESPKAAPAKEEGDAKEAQPEKSTAHSKEEKKVVEAESLKISTADIEKEAQKLTKEIESGIEKTVTRAQEEVGDLKKEMGSTRAKRWVDGLMTELVAEKAQLAEASKALNSSIRQKELEFRMKEQLFTEELKRRDDLLRQKSNALDRAKEQLSQAALAAERLKSAKSSGGDEGHFKQKYTLVQKMLNSAKDENKELSERVDDLKSQLLNHLNSTKRNQPSMSDFTALQAKYERIVRQSEEFKKANQQLMDKLGENKKERGGVSQDEVVKKRLEAALKMSTSHQKEAEKLQQRVEEMQREQMRLKAELNKANQDLKSARVGSKGQQAAPKPAQSAVPKPGTGGKGNPPKAA